MSACSARISTTLPFPSSPHCTPTPTTAGILDPDLPSSFASELQQIRRHDVRQLPEPVHYRCGNAFVDVHQRQRHAADGLAAELQAGDVDLRLAEQHADVADDARDVAVVEHQDVSFGHRLEVETVDPHQADHLASEHGA